MNSMKRQKDMTLKDELPRLLGAQYATGEEWRSNSRKNEEDSGAGKDWRQEEKGVTEDEMVGWYQWLDGHEFEQARGVDDL